MKDDIENAANVYMAASTTLSEEFREFEKNLFIDSETEWNALSEKQKLLIFCAISRRIYKGEIEDRGSYRYVLYEIFGFGPEAYVPAQVSRYLEIHNSIE